MSDNKRIAAEIDEIAERMLDADTRPDDPTQLQAIAIALRTAPPEPPHGLDPTWGNDPFLADKDA